MDCIQLTIPPLPQFISAGHDIWHPGRRHQERTFDVYDLLLVTKGTLFMKENGVEYAVGAGRLLLLEPGLHHIGHRPCEVDTEIYWVHFFHAPSPVRKNLKQIVWQEINQKSASHDLFPDKHSMYLPKWMELDPLPLLPLFNELNALHDHITVGSALQMNSLFIQLLLNVQQLLIRFSNPTPSSLLSRQLENYLSSKRKAPFHVKELEKQFHFHIDYLTRCLKKHTGMTPLQYVNYLKMEDAKRYLSQTDMTLNEIAERIGIADYNYFIRLFRQKTGHTPGDYRKRWQGYV